MNYEISENRLRGMVRDFEGRWIKYVDVKSSITGMRYFHGKQDMTWYMEQLALSKNMDYIDANLRCWDFLDKNIDRIKSIKQYDEYIEWLGDCHQTFLYRDTESSGIHNNYMKPSSNHTKIIWGDVMNLAEKYNDPYPDKVSGPTWKEIPVDGWPSDLIISKERVDHYYPYPKYFPDYLRLSLGEFNELLDGEFSLERLAKFYQITLNMHLYDIINNSMLMSIVNYILDKKGIPQVEHGILDFVAYRLQPDNFAKYFSDEVGRNK